MDNLFVYILILVAIAGAAGIFGWGLGYNQGKKNAKK